MLLEAKVMVPDGDREGSVARMEVVSECVPKSSSVRVDL